MEITSFILGVCAVIVIMMIVGTSVNYMAIKVLRKDIDNLTIAMEKGSEDLYRRLEQQQRDVIDYVDSLNNNAQDEMNTIYKTIDSRADKLDNKLNKDVESLIRELNILQQEISRVERGYKEKINYLLTRELVGTNFSLNIYLYTFLYRKICQNFFLTISCFLPKKFLYYYYNGIWYRTFFDI